MNRRAMLIAVSLMIVVGCGPSLPPGVLSRAEVEAKVKQGLGLTSVSLVEELDGRYAGTGIGRNGMKFNVIATLGKNQLSFEAASEDGTAKMSGDSTWSGPD